MADKKVERGGFYVVVNMETGPDIATARIADAADPKKVPFVPALKTFEQYYAELKEKEYVKIAKFKGEDTQERKKAEFKALDHKTGYQTLLDDYNKKLQMLAVHPPFAYIKIATMVINSDDKREVKIWKNENNDPVIEAKIIREVVEILYSTNHGNDSFNSHATVTFNGKRFDIPLLSERGQIRGVRNIPYDFLERLMSRGSRENHHDMIENRPYQNTVVNKLSLTRNLAIRFGIDCAKVQIDYAKCSIEELKYYSLDQVLKLEYWYRFHHGLEIPTVKEFLATLPNQNKAEPKEIPNIEPRKLPEL